MTRNDIEFLSKMLSAQAEILERQGEWREARDVSCEARQLGLLAGAMS